MAHVAGAAYKTHFMVWLPENIASLTQMQLDFDEFLDMMSSPDERESREEINKVGNCC